MTQLSRRAVLPVLAGAPLALAGCTGGQDTARALYILLDFSGTYYRQIPRCMTAVRALVARMNPFDQMVVARIDNCSFSNESVLLRFRLPDTPSAATRMKLAMGQELERIERNALRTGYTDIIGALYQASAELRATRARERAVVMFTDLVQDLSPDCRTGRDEMPNMSGITAVAANVIILNEAQPQAYFDRLQAWETRFRSAGAKDWVVVRDPLGVRDLFGAF
ncbi:MAG: hypothetical protein ACFB6R_10535 [Alphaproteobacteria bacterium]